MYNLVLLLGVLGHIRPRDSMEQRRYFTEETPAQASAVEATVDAGVSLEAIAALKAEAQLLQAEKAALQAENEKLEATAALKKRVEALRAEKAALASENAALLQATQHEQAAVESRTRTATQHEQAAAASRNRTSDRPPMDEEDIYGPLGYHAFKQMFDEDKFHVNGIDDFNPLQRPGTLTIAGHDYYAKCQAVYAFAVHRPDDVASFNADEEWHAGVTANEEGHLLLPDGVPGAGTMRATTFLDWLVGGTVADAYTYDGARLPSAPRRLPDAGGHFCGMCIRWRAAQTSDTHKARLLRYAHDYIREAWAGTVKDADWDAEKMKFDASNQAAHVEKLTRCLDAYCGSIRQVTRETIASLKNNCGEYVHPSVNEHGRHFWAIFANNPRKKELGRFLDGPGLQAVMAGAKWVQAEKGRNLTGTEEEMSIKLGIYIGEYSLEFTGTGTTMGQVKTLLSATPLKDGLTTSPGPSGPIMGDVILGGVLGLRKVALATLWIAENQPHWEDIAACMRIVHFLSKEKRSGNMPSLVYSYGDHLAHDDTGRIVTQLATGSTITAQTCPTTWAQAAAESGVKPGERPAWEKVARYAPGDNTYTRQYEFPAVTLGGQYDDWLADTWDRDDPDFNPYKGLMLYMPRSYDGSSEYPGAFTAAESGEVQRSWPPLPNPDGEGYVKPLDTAHAIMVFIHGKLKSQELWYSAKLKWRAVGRMAGILKPRGSDR